MRRRLTGLASAGALALGALLVPSAALAPAADAAGPALGDSLTVHPEWGSVTVPSGKLRKGCKSYPYYYALTPPEGDWAVETFVTGPDGEALWSGAFLNGSDDVSGSSVFTFCRPATRSGTFTIESKLTVQNGAGTDNYTEGQLPPTTFTLEQAAKKKKDSVIVPCC